jgi:7-cyano-7-deazaguanine synthase
MNNNPRAVLLLSGGLDSTTTLAIARQQGYQVHALSFRYGQRHQHEIEAAKAIAVALGAHQHEVLDIDLGRLVASALTSDIAVPKHDSADEIATSVPATYVPARNTVFLSYALGWAEELSCSDIFIGVNAVDYSGYPDCRPEFLAAFESLANVATKRSVVDGARVTIHAPLIELTKAEIVSKGISLGVDYGLTTSCYDPPSAGVACGRCDACLLRKRGFAENNLTDPICYATD